MNIINPTYTWNGTLTKRKVTTYLILHHAAGYGSAESIHAYHKSLGWLGIAYHYYVRLDGSIYRGRPENASGGHTTNYNYCSIGICAEGNFQVDTMSEAQRAALTWLVADIKTRYPSISVKRHKEFQNTSCPGANYPFDSIVSGTVVDPTPTPTPVTPTAPVAVSVTNQLKAYQTYLNTTYKAGLTLDGIWGPKTKAAVRTIQRGDRGEQVRILQTMLTYRGFDCNGIDGVFGISTYNALLAFQKSVGVTADGLAGKNTMEKIYTSTQTTSFTPYNVKVNVSALNYRSGPSIQYGVKGILVGGGIYTIVEESNGWGKLKSGAGWISLTYTSKVTN